MKRLWVVMLLVVLGTAAMCQPGFCKEKAGKALSARDTLIKSEIETAISMLQTISAKQQKGEMTLDQAKQLGADLLRGLRYGKDGYFWADTTEGVCVVLYGQKDVEGKNRLDLKDAKGKSLVRDLIATAKAGGGYEDYWFPKANETTPLPKRGYVQLFEPFGWVVGTGYYVTEKAPKGKVK
ncbi:MAG TPA: cache domain-containing protein [Syntrophorhabdaceae bacterium]|jgi:methyl-accepting chemotaxis protein